ncbi:hypothetical protein AAEH84_19615, partial [Shewanella indica]|uniref:hypothetical protein n=1 Tax=Shewanella indica TaxID=768528 RepID=UPI00313B2A22
TDRRPVMQDQIMESEKGSAYLGNNALSACLIVSGRCATMILVMASCFICIGDFGSHSSA